MGRFLPWVELGADWSHAESSRYILYGAAPKGAEFKSGKNLSEAVKAAVTYDNGGTGGIVHPTDDDFTQEMLLRHLAETNLQGARGMVSQGRELIDETQDLLAEVENDTRNEEDDRWLAITDTQDDLKRLDTSMGGLGEDLSTVSWTTHRSVGLTGNVSGAEVKAKKAVEFATRAHERIASYNDTRNEEDDRFLQIERNLGGLKNTTRFTFKAIRIEDA